MRQDVRTEGDYQLFLAPGSPGTPTASLPQ
jgi:hypothetical protein